MSEAVPLVESVLPLNLIEMWSALSATGSWFIYGRRSILEIL